VSTAGPAQARREAGASFLAALAAGGLLFWSVGERWASGRGSAGNHLIVVQKHVSGRDVAPLVAAAALIAIAGAVAIPATRRAGRTVAGALLLVGGVMAIVEALLRRHTGTGDLRKQLPADATAHATGWPYVAVVGGVLLVAVGMVLVVRGRRWAGLSARYEAPGTSAPTAPVAEPTDARAWDALDRGEDPTEPADAGD
jgi:uncharacterized membrane protein (TIGR02234 family)